MDTILQNLADVVEYIAAIIKWMISVISGEALTAFATICVAIATGFTLRIAKISNKRQEKERYENLKSERAEKLVNLTNFMLQNRELFNNAEYPISDRSGLYEAIIRFNFGSHKERRTRKINRYNFVIVRNKNDHGAILSFSYMGDYKVEPMSIEIDKEPELDSEPEKWDMLFDALKSSINRALIGSGYYLPPMLPYYSMNSQTIKETIGSPIEAKGHAIMNSTVDRSLVDAILKINVKSVKKLVKSITHIDARDMKGKTFLHYAVQDAHNQILSDKNYSTDEKENLHRGISKEYAFKMQKDLNEIISILIDKNADVNAKDNRGTPIIYCAASVNNPWAIYMLGTAGADVNAISDYNNGAAIHIASYSGWDDVVEKLIEHGADVHCRDLTGKTPLHMASAEGWASTIGKLIQHGLSIDDTDSSGETPLHKASSSSSLSAVKELIQHGAKKGVNDKNEIGETPLHKASSWGPDTIIDTLISIGSDINVKNNRGETPLHIAIRDSQFETNRDQPTVDALLRHGADLYCVDISGVSPYDLINRNRWDYILLDKLNQECMKIYLRFIKRECIGVRSKKLRL